MTDSITGTQLGRVDATAIIEDHIDFILEGGGFVSPAACGSDEMESALGDVWLAVNQGEDPAPAIASVYAVIDKIYRE